MEKIDNTNWKKFEASKYILRLGDSVTFLLKDKILIYECASNHLAGRNCFNDAIFNELEIEKVELFCARYYGYYPTSGVWPSCKSGDFSALTKLVYGLFSKCSKESEITKSIKLGKVKSKLLDTIEKDESLDKIHTNPFTPSREFKKDYKRFLEEFDEIMKSSDSRYTSPVGGLRVQSEELSIDPDLLDPL